MELLHWFTQHSLNWLICLVPNSYKTSAKRRFDLRAIKRRWEKSWIGKGPFLSIGQWPALKRFGCSTTFYGMGWPDKSRSGLSKWHYRSQATPIGCNGHQKVKETAEWGWCPLSALLNPVLCIPWGKCRVRHKPTAKSSSLHNCSMRFQSQSNENVNLPDC